jgi:AcrR family transcriptional regulator
MTRAPTRIYRGVPAQQRRAERRRKLMDAALEIMGTEGWGATSVRGVCQRSRLTPRFFYESFEDIDALAVAVLDEIVATATARALEAIAAAPDEPAAKIRAAIETMVGELTADPRRARVAFVEALGSEPMMKRRLALMRDIARVIAAQARATYDLPAEANPFVEVTSIVFAGGLVELLIVWLEGGLNMSRDELIDRCVELLATTGEGAAALARRHAAGDSSPPAQSTGG